MGMKTFKCAWCNQLSTKERGRKKYCSHFCANQFYWKAGSGKAKKAESRMRLKCEVCGAEFNAQFRLNRKQSCCSNKCAAILRQSRSPKRVSLSELEEADSHHNLTMRQKVVRLASLKTCTVFCVYYWARRHKFQFKANPIKLRKSLSSITPERNWAKALGCLICSESRCVEASHVIPRTRNGRGEIGNILPLCANHHYLFDRKTLNTLEMERLIQQALTNPIVTLAKESRYELIKYFDNPQFYESTGDRIKIDSHNMNPSLD